MISIKRIAAALTIVAASATGALAVDSDHKFEKAAEYYGQCVNTEESDFLGIREQLRAFTDMEVMAETLNDPHKLFKLMEVLNDPRTMHVMANCATEPVMWDTWVKGIATPSKWVGAMAKMMNPEGMLKWAIAPVDSQIYASILTHAEPEKYVRWANATTNAAFYTPLTNMLDVDWYEPRIEWLITADSYAPFVTMFIPD